MANLRFEDLEKGLTLEDMTNECYALSFFLTKEDAGELRKRFKEYHGDNPNYKEMPFWKFIYENVEVTLRR